MIEVRHERGDLSAVGDHQQVIGEAVGVAVAEDAALRIQYKAIVAGAFGQALDVVGEHAVEPAHPIRAADGDLPAIAAVEGPRAFNERSQLLRKTAEDWKREAAGEFLQGRGGSAEGLRQGGGRAYRRRGSRVR